MTSPFPSIAAPPPPPPRVPPLHLVVRFLALPDIPLEIADPDRFTVVRLKTRIRQELAARAVLEEEGLSKTQQKQKQKQKAQDDANEILSPTNLSNSPTLQDAPRRRLRILYAGRHLADDTVLGQVLRPVAPPPRANRSSSMSTPTPVSTPTPASTPIPTPHQQFLAPPSADTNRSRSSSTSTSSNNNASQTNLARVIVSCSISDVLPDSELAAEAEAAAVSEAAAERAAAAAAAAATAAAAQKQKKSLSGDPAVANGYNNGLGLRRDIFQRRGGGSSTAGRGGGGASGSSSSAVPSSSAAPASTANTTTPAPRGFQRLLQGGFSPAEVNQLRLQFTSIQAARFTPDTMPSPDTLRRMEDSWLDNNHEAVGGSGSNSSNDDVGGTTTNLPDEEGRLPALLDLMVKAMLVGFMMPLASGCWLLREEGLWTARWRMFVSLGMMVSILIGMIKAFAGEW